MDYVDLDHNATTPLTDVARDAWLQAQALSGGNPNSTHARGQAARLALDTARQQLGAILGCKAHELVVCGSGTEANALAIYAARQQAVKKSLNGVWVSAIEHSSVLRPAEGPDHHVLAVDGCGRLTPETIAQQVAPDAACVAFQFANNETGTLQDVPALVAAIRAQAPQALIVLDCCQGAGKAALNFRELGIDFASISAHKFGGPKGVGLLYVRSGVMVEPLIKGGRQQMDRRSGTEDVAGCCAAAAALQAAEAKRSEQSKQHRAWLDAAWHTIQTALPDAQWVAYDAPRLANTMNLVHPGVRSEALITRLNLAGFAVSPGSACMAARGEPSHVIAALGIPNDRARSAVRISLGSTTTEAGVQAFANAYIEHVQAQLSRS